MTAFLFLLWLWQVVDVDDGCIVSSFFVLFVFVCIV